MSEPALPAGTRLLHIGLPKTGTTSLQRGLALNRDALLAAGVCYPGTAFNHRDQVAALMQRPLGWRTRGAKLHDRGLWDRLMAQVRRAESDGVRRSFISHEFCCESTDDQAARFVEELGADRIHVAVTLRGFAELLPSNWQQFVKAGYTKGFDRWLKDVLTPRPRQSTVKTFLRRNDQAAIVDRWVRLVGPDRVTVVIADKTRPAQLISAFESMLGLPAGATAARPVGGYVANRSLSSAETELVRRVNSVVHQQGYDWLRYTQLIRHGVIARMQECRSPGETEAKVVLPEWAAEAAAQRAEQYTRAIAESGCRVIGELSTLTAAVSSVPRVPDVDRVPIEAAVEAVSGLLSAADGRGPFFDQATEGLEGRRTTMPLLEKVIGPEHTLQVLNAHRATRHLGGRSLAAVGGLRLSEKLRRH